MHLRANQRFWPTVRCGDRRRFSDVGSMDRGVPPFRSMRVLVGAVVDQAVVRKPLSADRALVWSPSKTKTRTTSCRETSARSTA